MQYNTSEEASKDFITLEAWLGVFLLCTFVTGQANGNVGKEWYS